MAKKWEVEVMEGKANLEVRPTFINKGEIVKRLVREYNNSGSATTRRTREIAHNNTDQQAQAADGGANAEGSGPSNKLEFVLCCGDDFTDEDMFRALNGVISGSSQGLADDHVFTVSVGARNKVTLAKWHVLEPKDVLESTALLVGVGLTGKTRDQLSQVNLAAVAGLEGHMPEQGN